MTPNTPSNDHEVSPKWSTSESTIDQTIDILNSSPKALYESISKIDSEEFARAYCSKYFVPMDYARLHVAEVKKLLSLMVSYHDLDLRPSDQLRNVWTTMILETENYINMCETLGWYIHFSSSFVRQSIGNQQVLELYQENFGEIPAIWKNSDNTIPVKAEYPWDTSRTGW